MMVGNTSGAMKADCIQAVRCLATYSAAITPSTIAIRLDTSASSMLSRKAERMLGNAKNSRNQRKDSDDGGNSK